MSAIPTWLIGKNVTSIAIIPQTVGSDGTLTAGSSQSLTGHLDEITLDQENETENLVPLDVRQDNEVIIGSRTNLNLVEILSSNGAAGNFLATVAEAYDYVSCTFSRGGKLWTGFFVIKSYGESIRRGKSVGTLAVGPCGIAPTLA